MKAFFGSWSDAVPVMGYNKRYYIVGAAFLGTAAFSVLATAHIHRPRLAAVLFLLGHVEAVICDLLCEGKYAEMMVARPETGSDAVAWVWGMYSLGKLLASSLIGCEQCGK